MRMPIIKAQIPYALGSSPIIQSTASATCPSSCHLVEIGAQETSRRMWILWLMLLVGRAKSFVSDCGVSCLLPALMKNCDRLTCELEGRVKSLTLHCS